MAKNNNQTRYAKMIYKLFIYFKAFKWKQGIFFIRIDMFEERDI